MNWIPAVLAVAVVGGAIGLARWQRPEPPTQPQDVGAAEPVEPSPEVVEYDPSPESPAPEPEEDPAGLVGATTDFYHLPDGSEVPPLPTDAPLRVKLAVAVFRYEGAQGAGSVKRSRAEAKKLAEQALALGSEQFGKIVEAGDSGSSSNIGWIERNILEPSVEYAVFNLDQGELLDRPLDTPRGYWVVKRTR